MQDTLSERIMVRLDPKTRVELEKRAQAEHRRVSEFVRLLVEREVCAQPPHPAPADAA